MFEILSEKHSYWFPCVDVEIKITNLTKTKNLRITYCTIAKNNIINLSATQSSTQNYTLFHSFVQNLKPVIFIQLGWLLFFSLSACIEIWFWSFFYRKLRAHLKRIDIFMVTILYMIYEYENYTWHSVRTCMAIHGAIIMSNLHEHRSLPILGIGLPRF